MLCVDHIFGGSKHVIYIVVVLHMLTLCVGGCGDEVISTDILPFFKLHPIYLQVA